MGMGRQAGEGSGPTTTIIIRVASNQTTQIPDPIPRASEIFQLGAPQHPSRYPSLTRQLNAPSCAPNKCSQKRSKKSPPTLVILTHGPRPTSHAPPGTWHSSTHSEGLKCSTTHSLRGAQVLNDTSHSEGLKYSTTLSCEYTTSLTHPSFHVMAFPPPRQLCTYRNLQQLQGGAPEHTQQTDVTSEAATCR